MRGVRTRCVHACMHAAMLCRLPGSNLLFGLPVVMDTNNDSIKPGSKVSGHHRLCTHLDNMLLHAASHKPRGG